MSRILHFYNIKFTTFNIQNVRVELVFATHNAHKVSEVAAMLPDCYQLKSLDEIGFHKEIPETENTLEGNALLKAQGVYNAIQLPSFSDDTGLFIHALNGAPGVLSARYASSPSNAQSNMQKVLSELTGSTDRKAFFLTVIALVSAEGVHYFHGKVEGVILHKPRGTGGFGYDPIFKPHGYDLSFAELPTETKNTISHRALALQSLMVFLTETKFL